MDTGPSSGSTGTDLPMIPPSVCRAMGGGSAVSDGPCYPPPRERSGMGTLILRHPTWVTVAEHGGITPFVTRTFEWGAVIATRFVCFESRASPVRPAAFT